VKQAGSSQCSRAKLLYDWLVSTLTPSHHSHSLVFKGIQHRPIRGVPTETELTLAQCSNSHRPARKTGKTCSSFFHFYCTSASQSVELQVDDDSLIHQLQQTALITITKSQQVPYNHTSSRKACHSYRQDKTYFDSTHFHRITPMKSSSLYSKRTCTNCRES
jgi:hypothetical protein